MNIIQFMKQYRHDWCRAIDKTKELDKIDEMLGLGGGGNDGMPRGSKISDPTADMGIRLADLSRETRQAQLTAVMTTNEINMTIARAGLTDVEYSIIHAKYIEMADKAEWREPSWSDIAQKLNYSISHCKNTHKEALKKIDKARNER